MTLKGTFDKPELTLTSEPSYPRERLMIMLATGKGWQSIDDSISNGLNPVALTKDFIDYYFFSGVSNRFAEKFGVKSLAVKYDGNTAGISAKKAMTDKLEIGYGIEQSDGGKQEKKMTQKIEGEYKISEKMSVVLERESKKDSSGNQVSGQSDGNNDKVLVKYKKSF